MFGLELGTVGAALETATVLYRCYLGGGDEPTDSTPLERINEVDSSRSVG